MRGTFLRIFLYFLAALEISALSLAAQDRWRVPFDSGDDDLTVADTALTLRDAINLVAVHNPTLRSLQYRRDAARDELVQAGLRPNPELAIQLEEFGWDAPGFRKSEIAVSLSQELELFGQRTSRRLLAQTVGLYAAYETGADDGADDRARPCAATFVARHGLGGPATAGGCCCVRFVLVNLPDSGVDPGSLPMVRAEINCGVIMRGSIPVMLPHAKREEPACRPSCSAPPRPAALSG